MLFLIGLVACIYVCSLGLQLFVLFLCEGRLHRHHVAAPVHGEGGRDLERLVVTTTTTTTTTNNNNNNNTNTTDNTTNNYNNIVGYCLYSCRMAKVIVRIRLRATFKGGSTRNSFFTWLPTNGVNTNGAAAKVINFGRLGKKVCPGTFGNMKVG